MPLSPVRGASCLWVSLPRTELNIEHLDDGGEGHGPRGQKHDQHRNGHRRNHYPDLLRHADSGDDRVECEKTISRSPICSTVARRVPRAFAVGSKPAASSLTWISWVLFAIRKSPPAMRIRSLPLTGWEKTAPRGSVNPISHLMDSSSRIRVTNARLRPMVRALTR